MQRAYRLIDDCFEPHRQLDDCYTSLDEAIGDAIAWLEQTGAEPHHQLIGVEVCAANGDWRTYRLPMPLLCSLPSSPSSSQTDSPRALALHAKTHR